MALVADNVFVAGTGGVYVGAKGTTGPTSATASIPSGFTTVGFLHDDGITFNPNEEVKDIKAFQNALIVRKVVTRDEYEFEFTMLETNATTVGLFFKDAAFTGGAITAGNRDHRAFILDAVDGDKMSRWVLPDAEVTKRGNVTWKNDDAALYKVTITAYPSSAGSPGFFYYA